MRQGLRPLASTYCDQASCRGGHGVRSASRCACPDCLLIDVSSSVCLWGLMSTSPRFVTSAPLDNLAGEGEGGFVCTRRRILITSSCLWGCYRGSGVPSPLAGSPPTINYWSGFVFGVWRHEALCHRPGDWGTSCQADALLTGAVRTRRTLARSDTGDITTAAQLLLGIVYYPPPFVLGIVSASAPWY